MTICNCGHDENGKYIGGKAGDQSKNECYIRSWYNRPWNCVLRPKTKKLGDMIADISSKMCKNNTIGYDQGNRLSYFNALKDADWKPEKIKTKVETDCSASTMANIIAAGNRLKIDKLKKLSPSLTTREMREALVKTGQFELLTTSKYRNSDNYLIAGDILLNIQHHVAVNLTKGPRATSTPSKSKSNKTTKTDGWWGPDTTRVTQKVFKTPIDGVVSKQPRALKSDLPRATAASWQFLSKGFKGGSDVVKAIQKFFKKKKLYKGKIDGYFGILTTEAMQKFLKVKVTKKLDTKTVIAWQKYINTKVK